MSWWTGEQYRGQSTTNVLRSYDQRGVGTRTRDAQRYGDYNGSYGGGGERTSSRDVDSMNTTWDTMGRGLSRRPYDDSMMSTSYSSGNNVGRYSGLRASGGSTRFR